MGRTAHEGEWLVSEQIVVALISGGAALVVAVLGILGAIAAQPVATRRAFRTSLALFEKQEIAQRQAWLEQTRREDLHRFAEHRRNTYSRLMRLADDLVAARDEERTVSMNLNRKERQRHRGEQTPELLEDIDQQERAAAECRDRTRRLRAELDDIADGVQLLASEPVHDAAEALRAEATRASHREAPEYRQARSSFLTAARVEPGVRGPRPAVT